MTATGRRSSLWRDDSRRGRACPYITIRHAIVRLVDLRPNALYLVRKPTLVRKNSPDWGFRGPISRFYYSETRLAANASEKTTPKLVWLPTGLSRLLAVSGDDFKYSETRFVARLLAPRLPGSPDVSQACNLGERWRRNLLALSVPTGPRTHPLHRRQRDGSKHAQ